MTTRVLRIKLATALRGRLQTQAKSLLAKEIGVSPQKLNSMIDDDWEYITRDAIERAADYLQLDASDLFEFVPVDFWKPIEEEKKCTFLRGLQGARSTEPEFRMPWYDEEATSAIKSFLRDLLEDSDEAFIADSRQEEEDLLKRATLENCIVIGSPKSNAASEILLSRFFGAAPFDPSANNRRKIPFGFCWQDGSPIAERSSLTCSELARKEAGDRPGIAVRGGVHVDANYRALEAFRGWETRDGLDCGLVFVANRPFGTAHNVKLIVLAGFSGVGTLAAARALLQDFRYLEQVGDESCVYGVVEGRYSKSAHTSVRKFRDFNWRYRRGGYWPIKGEKANRAKGAPD
jgi:hypothetical protein